MAITSAPSSAVSKRETLGRRHRNFGRIVDNIGKYAVDFAVNLSSKAHFGRGRLHRTVREEIRDQLPLKPCNNSEKTVGNLSEKKTQTKMEEVAEEMSTVKHKTEVSAEVMEPVSLDKLPPEQLKGKDILLPNKRRIMIRSRL